MSEILTEVTRQMQELSPVKKKTQKPATVRDGKPSKAELFWRLKSVVDKLPTTIRKQFPETFRVYKSDVNTKMLFVESVDGLCTAVNERYLEHTVAKYLADILITDATDAWVFTAKDVSEFARLWITYAEPVPEPKAWTFKSSTERAFTRLPWDLEPGPTPTWDDLLSRASAPEALCAYLGSLFVDESDRQQYLWIYGVGNDGKGSLFRFLHRCFGSSFGNEYVPKGKDNFWTSGLLNKRVIIFPDCNDSEFVTTGLFKSLTGGDPVRIELKGKQAFTALISAKFIYGSNDKPKISGQKSDLRRLIYCELRTWAGEPDANFEKRLWSEGGAFIKKCLQAYEKASPNHGVIGIDQDDVELLASHTEEEYASVADLFEFSSTFHCQATHFYNAVRYKLRDHKIGRFKDYLARRYSVVKRRVGSPRVEIYEGLKLKTLMDLPDTNSQD